MKLCTSSQRTTIVSLLLAGTAGIIIYGVARARHRAEAKHREDCLDTALEDSFPASDPLPFPSTHAQGANGPGR